MVTGDLCLQDLVYEYTFANEGSAPIEITEASSLITGNEATDLIPSIDPTTLQPGESTSVQEQSRVDYCAGLTTTTVTAQGSPEPCTAEASITVGSSSGGGEGSEGGEGGRRALRAN